MIKAAPMVLVALLCASCAHAGRSTLTQHQRDAIQQIVDGEAGNFSTCRTRQIDLNKDGEPETVFTFRVGLSASQIRILEWHDEQSTVLLDNGSNTPNTVFCLSEGVPTAVFERLENANGEPTQLVYQWDGQTFVPSESGACKLEQGDLVWTACSRGQEND